MRMRTGLTEYGSGLHHDHPFNLRVSRLHQRNLKWVAARVQRWQYLAGISIGLILCNGLLTFLLSEHQVPVVFVDLVLPTGKIYQQGVLAEKPLSKKVSRQMIPAHHPDKKESGKKPLDSNKGRVKK